MANDFRLTDNAAGTVVALPNMGLADVAYYTSGDSPAVAGATRWHTAPVAALPYEMETDGRAVVDPSWMANPGLSSVVPVADLDNQGRTYGS